MLTINAEQTATELVQFLRASFEQAGFSQAVIALSGGIDSATSCALTVQALGAASVYPVLLPCGSLNPQGVADALSVADTLHIPRANVTQVDINPLVAPVLALDPSMDHIRQGNIMARMRMIVAFDRARRQSALVVGTENKSEHLLGYFTRFGDEASDIEPLRGLYKTQVYHLAGYLQLPEPILTKKPTAGLWEGQTDEGEFGFTYAAADEILHLLYDQRETVAQVVAAGWDQATVERVKAWVEKNDFKHHLPMTRQ